MAIVAEAFRPVGELYNYPEASRDKFDHEIGYGSGFKAASIQRVPAYRQTPRLTLFTAILMQRVSHTN